MRGEENYEGGRSRSDLAPGRGAPGGSQTARSPQALRRAGRAARTRRRTNFKLRHYRQREKHERRVGSLNLSGSDRASAPCRRGGSTEPRRAWRAAPGRPAAAGPGWPGISGRCSAPCHPKPECAPGPPASRRPGCPPSPVCLRAAALVLSALRPGVENSAFVGPACAAPSGQAGPRSDALSSPIVCLWTGAARAGRGWERPTPGPRRPLSVFRVASHYRFVSSVLSCLVASSPSCELAPISLFSPRRKILFRTSLCISFSPLHVLFYKTDVMRIENQGRGAISA